MATTARGSRRTAILAGVPSGSRCFRLVAARRVGALTVALCLLCLGSADAQEPVRIADRTVVRFSAPETGGVAAPRFVFERVLALEARFEALADPGYRSTPARPYTETHVRVALERHIAETLLASLRIEPEPSQSTVEGQMTLARAMLTSQVGGDTRLREAAVAEGIGTQELRRLFRRRALASLYLHHMVAPMLTPRDSQLYELHQKSALAGQPFEQVKDELRRLYVSRALGEAVTAFFQNARSRLRVTILE